MGSPTDEQGRHDNEIRHRVTMTTAVEVLNSEVTLQQYVENLQWAYDQGIVTMTAMRDTIYDSIDGSTQVLRPLGWGVGFSNSTGTFYTNEPARPVQNLTWYGAVAYCDWLSMRAGLPRAYDHDTWLCNAGNPYAAVGYRLPTEAEWEYACRAGSSSAFANGSIQHLGCGYNPYLQAIGWFCGNSYSNTANDVAQKEHNSWGIYDMHGNVGEWCNEYYSTYSGLPETDPVGGSPATWPNRRILRGGYCLDVAEDCRSARRGHALPLDDSPMTGVRPVRSIH